MSEIIVHNITKRFGELEVLKGVSLDIRDQEFTVLLGPSGCGKTTLLRIIAGLETESAGEITIGGRQVTSLPPRARSIAMVFQNYAVFPHMTIYDNIAFGLKMKKVPKATIDEKVQKAAGLMHIDHLLGRYSAQLSGGQRQRVAVARALAMEPEVLLMDEPLSNLDALLRLEMRAELKALLQESRTTTVYVTHDQVEAMSLADRIAVMQEGRIIQYDTPMTIYQDPASAFCGGFIGNPPMNFLKARRADRGAAIGTAHLPAPAGPEELLFGIRPEDVSLASGEPGAEGAFLSGRLEVLEPLGPHTLLTLSVEGQLFRVTTDSDITVKPGMQLTLKPREDRVRWFDAGSGAALS